MIKLSAVKVRLQYRTRVRYRYWFWSMRGSRGPSPRAGITGSVRGRFGGGGNAGGRAASRPWCRPILGTGRGGCRPRPSS